jgi:hypothetical protein
MKTKRIPVPENWKDLKPHPLAELVPYGAGIDTAKMAEHMWKYKYDEGEPVILIERNGVLEILEGRHRHVAAQEADVTPTFAIFVGGDPLPYLMKKLLRQHLNESQRAMLAAKLIELAKEGNTDSTAEKTGTKSKSARVRSKDKNGSKLEMTHEQAAEVTNVSERNVDNAVKVNEEGGEKLKDEVAAGNVKVGTAVRTMQNAFCPRCTRCGPQRNCPKCQELWAKTALAARKKISKPKKIGAEKFDWKAFDTHYGFVARGPDDLKRAYGPADEFVECDALLRQFRKVWDGWRKRVLHSKD